MTINKTRKMILLIFSTLIVFLLISCDDFKDETLKPENTDALAIEVFNDTSVVQLSLATIDYDTTISEYVSTYQNQVDTIGAEYSAVWSFLNENLNAKIDLGKTHYQTTIAGSQRDNTILISISGTKEIVVYTTQYVDVNIYDADKIVMDNDASYPVELTAGIIDYDEEDSSDYPKPLVKTRNSFELSAGTYILNINSTEATTSTTFDLVTIEKQ